MAKKRGQAGGKGILITGIVLALLVIVIIVSIVSIRNALRPTEAGQPQTITLKSGMSTPTFVQKLEDAGIIRSAIIFEYYLRYVGEGSKFQAGVYEITPGITNDELITMLNSGQTIQEKVIRVTIPEGYTVDQIAERLADHGVIDQKAFLQAVNSKKQWTNLQLISNIPVMPVLKYRLEGYLFPNTYDFKVNQTADQVVERLLHETDVQLANLPSDWQQRMKKLNLNLHQTLVIASLIEREVVVDEERPIVAGIVYNRLKAKMPLQFCSTVQFLLKEQKDRLLYSDLKVDSAYNTYKNTGLPPGPIASPGLESIKATLYPQKSDYLYFVTKEDGTKSHYFGKTFAEHQHNIQLSRKNAQK